MRKRSCLFRFAVCCAVYFAVCFAFGSWCLCKSIPSPLPRLTRFKTKVIKNNLNPSWDETFKFTLGSPLSANTPALNITVKDKERFVIWFVIWFAWLVVSLLVSEEFFSCNPTMILICCLISVSSLLAPVPFKLPVFALLYVSPSQQNQRQAAGQVQSSLGCASWGQVPHQVLLTPGTVLKRV